MHLLSLFGHSRAVLRFSVSETSGRASQGVIAPWGRSTFGSRHVTVIPR